MPVNPTIIDPMAGYDWNAFQKAQDAAIKRQSVEMENAYRGMQMAQDLQKQQREAQLEQMQNVLRNVDYPVDVNAPLPSTKDIFNQAVQSNQELANYLQKNPKDKGKLQSAFSDKYERDYATRLTLEKERKSLSKEGSRLTMAKQSPDGTWGSVIEANEGTNLYRSLVDQGYVEVQKPSTAVKEEKKVEAKEPSFYDYVWVNYKKHMGELTADELKSARKGWQEEQAKLIKQKEESKGAGKAERPRTERENAVVKAWGEGRVDPALLSRVDKSRMLGFLLEDHPYMDTLKYDQNVKSMMDPNTLRSMKNIQAVLPRFKELKKLYDGQKNSNIPLYNKIVNEIHTQLGQPFTTAAEYSRDTIAQEMMLALSNSSQGSDLRVDLDRLGLDPKGMSPAQWDKAVDVALGALQTKEGANKILPNKWKDEVFMDWRKSNGRKLDNLDIVRKYIVLTGDKDLAMEQAKDDGWTSLNASMFYKAAKSEAKSGTDKSSIPSREDFIKAAMAANPTKTRDELGKYWDNKYGK